jgi:hypothetical protein
LEEGLQKDGRRLKKQSADFFTSTNALTRDGKLINVIPGTGSHDFRRKSYRIGVIRSSRI